MKTITQEDIDQIPEGGTLRIPAGVTEMRPVIFYRPIHIVGEPGSLLKAVGGDWKHWMAFRSRFMIVGVTIDAALSGAANWPKRSAILSKGSRGSILGCHFIHSPEFAVSIKGGNVFFEIEGCYFHGGVQNSDEHYSAFVRAWDDVSLTVRNSTFRGAPTAGIVHQMSTGNDTRRGSLRVTDCDFVYCGFDNKNTFGSIDAYSGCDDVMITGNRIERGYGRGICVKADASRAMIANNIISDIRGDHATAAIALFGTKLEDLGHSRLVTGNVIDVSNPTCLGMTIAGGCSEPGRISAAQVIGNSIRHSGVGVRIRDCGGALFTGNEIDGGRHAIQLTRGNVGEFRIAGNSLTSSKEPVSVLRQQNRGVIRVLRNA